jgi:serine/threonine-protein kinase
MTLVAGQRLLDRYVLKDEIGQGGMARIFAAADERTEKRVAVKQLDFEPDSPHFETMRTWFKRELRALMSLDHPNIVRLLDHGEADDGIPFVVMEFLEGKDLGDIVRARGKLSAAAGVQVALSALSALAAAHEKGVVHRDLKPSNLFLCTSGRVVVLDFGLARSTDASQGTLARGLQTKLIGTPKYYSPEQLAGVSLSPKSDLYSLGALLVFIFSGDHLYPQTKPLDIVHAISVGDHPPLSQLLPNAPPSLVAAITQLLEQEPDDRPSDAAAALRVFERVARELGHVQGELNAVAAHMDEAPTEHTQVVTAGGATVIRTITATPTSPPLDPRRRFPMLVAGALVVLASAIAWIAWPRPPPRPPRPTPVVAEPAGDPPARAEILPPTPPPVETPPSVPDVPEAPAKSERPKPTPPTVKLPPKPGKVRCRLQQWAEVTIDGKAQGVKEVAATFELSAGDHELVFRNSAFPEKRVRVNIKPDEELPLQVNFKN